MSDESDLMAFETARCAAIAQGDKDALRAMLAEDYVHVFGGGQSGGKEDWIAHVTDVPRIPVRENLQVRVYGDTAVLTGTMINKIRPGDNAKPADEIGGRVPVKEDVHAFATQVAVRKPGTGWQFVSFQMTRCLD